jgi:hypothetical protein
VVNLKYYSSKYYTITGIGTRDLPTGLPLWQLAPSPKDRGQGDHYFHKPTNPVSSKAKNTMYVVPHNNNELKGLK